MRLNIYKILNYGREVWTIRSADRKRFSASEMKFMRGNADFTLLDGKRNETVVKRKIPSP
jgi:hypothetical protein